MPYLPNIIKPLICPKSKQTMAKSTPFKDKNDLEKQTVSE